MHTIDSLYKLTLSPKINDISLKLLKDYYEAYLSPYIFTYQTTDLSKNISFSVMLSPENFCHLLGIEKIHRFHVNKKYLYQYYGISGWNNIDTGIITFDSMKTLNPKGFNDNKYKYIYFYSLPRLLENPLAIKFDPIIYKSNGINRRTNLSFDIVFYDVYDHAFVHLGLIKNETTGYYVPQSLFVEKEKKVDPYTDNQQTIIVSKTNITVLL